MVHPLSNESQNTTLLEKLRYDLISGYFPPSQKLDLAPLKKRYTLEEGPLREALSRLISHGLVQTDASGDFFVPALTLEELYDLYNVRIQIETLALELSIQSGDAAWEAEVRACWQQYSQQIDPQLNTSLQPVAWDALQKKFCITLIKACQSPWLLKIHNMLYDQASRYRFLCMGRHYNDKTLLSVFMRENEALVQAVLSRNIEKAVQITQAGWDTSLQVMAKALQDKPTNTVSL